jgi:ATP-dependent RNA helicase DeaD
MLAAIEQATRQPITQMNLPTRKDISDRRVGLFKEQIAEAMESQELDFFEELIDSYQSEYDVGLRRIAATLAYLVQKERPLQPEGHFVEEVVEAEPAPSFALRAAGQERTREVGMQSYRIEVGRTHGVEPKHIVGAISNEANITSRGIGQIRIYDSHSTVDLQDDLSSEVLRHLQGVWICGQRLQLTPLLKGSAAPPPRFPKRQPYSKEGEKRPFKPGAKKPPHSRRGGPKS